MNKALKLLCMVSLLILTAVFSGCGNDGDKFVGSWTGLEDPDKPLSRIHRVDITQNGDNFIVKIKMGSYNEFGDKLEWDAGNEYTKSAVLKDGKLVMEGAFQPIYYTYVEKDNTLMFSEYGGVSMQKDDDGKLYEKLIADAEPLAAERLEKNTPKATTKIIDNPWKKYGGATW